MKEVGLGTRVVNFIVDTIIIFLISYGLYKWYSFYVYYYQWRGFQFYYFFWATMSGYSFLFELLFKRTPGKWLTMTKVRSADGTKAGVLQLLIRSILRVTLIDPFFIPFFERPLHDQLSKTRVVEK